MAARPTWKGFLKISLVNIPVRVFPATDSAATISFNQLHAECQTRIQQKRWCPHCEREVANTELAKGYEFEKGRYVIVSEEDIEKVRVESTRVIDLAQFTEDSAIDPIYVAASYYLAPDRGGDRAYRLMRDALEHADLAAVAAYAARGKQYVVMLRPFEDGLVMHQLRYADEVKPWSEVAMHALAKPKPAAVEDVAEDVTDEAVEAPAEEVEAAVAEADTADEVVEEAAEEAAADDAPSDEAEEDK